MTGSPWAEPFRWTEENKERLRELWRSGKSGYEISKIMRITRSSVMGKLNRLGLLDGTRSNSPYNNERYRMTIINKQLARQKAAGAQPEASKGRVGRRVPLDAPSPPPLPKKRKSSWAGIPGEVDVLRPGECRFPLGEPMETFCKAPAGTDSYCPYHRSIASSPPGGEPKVWYEHPATHKKYFRHQ